MTREGKSGGAFGIPPVKGEPVGDGLAIGRRSRESPANSDFTPEERWNMIAVAAYYRAEQRGFIGGNPAEDWIAAEEEIDTLLSGNK
uniref:DUF2934 domain-containing protein n=1 Tax=Candidatus Kentrum sp. TC TaxID=2126339 RepID=A0A450YLV3_9GAMM|nr:MAG: Protein of unknown function (DUF2934) [Candidatus Kentron sp. TC]VFK43249.1 MAG: Protein of unknown function (DUF2934) [Candidatus Kentron sp. TC]VFK56915.1 MAG: Protein of unknown function (DUF2934) [Candidatus Kentron sp. TC]